MNQTISMDKQDPPQQKAQDFLKRLEEISNIEEKLRASIHLMRDALTQKIVPNFKAFWEIRKVCLPLFKEPLDGSLRSELWVEYIELTREGRRLKNMLNSESAFAIEQIDLAIIALENEIGNFTNNSEQELGKISDVGIPQGSALLKDKYPYYSTTQKRLQALHIYASRITGLRKELVQNEMRIRQKNQFFQRLSKIGDQIFPIRKDLIKEISDSFESDVCDFVDRNFSECNFSYNKVSRSVFFFREEIKLLQSIAKVLTLNTQTFSKTREMLSQCWDKLAGMEKEWKKEHINQKKRSEENYKNIQKCIQDFVSDYENGKYSLESGFQEIERILREMRSVELVRPHVQHLKDELSRARKSLEEKQDSETQLRKEKQAEFEKARREKVDSFKNELESLLQTLDKEDVETLTNKLESCRSLFAAISTTKVERQQFERKIKLIRDHIADRQEKLLIGLSEDDLMTLNNLNSVLDQRKQRRQEVKVQIEKYRKLSGSSGLDFDKAMQIQDQINVEKERLLQLEEGICDIEKKIRDLKTK